MKNIDTKNQVAIIGNPRVNLLQYLNISWRWFPIINSKQLQHKVVFLPKQSVANIQHCVDKDDGAQLMETAASWSGEKTLICREMTFTSGQEYMNEYIIVKTFIDN